MRKILITGAGSGLGEALAKKYACEGAEICIADVNEEAGNAVAEKIQSLGGEAFFLKCDITQQWDVDKLVMTVAERWRSIDMLINNAGVASAGNIEDETMEQWRWVLDINLLGQVRMTKACLPLLQNSQAADKTIINIASQAGLTSAPGMASYCVTKAAMVSLSETMYLELSAQNIHVAVVCPTFFDSNLNQSLRSSDDKMQALVTKLIKKSGISADDVAAKVFEAVAKKKFIIITDKDGRNAHRLKRFLPMEMYLNIVKKRMAKFVKKNA
ncbi:MAG: NAD(P)-dependent dehydrogenase (short-subunit alcohol dehydrogenase family) [Arenicella sp.]|jgi:NAD(P)-dependent dehydrogenase (short-subunit alcohol dehydrogenase family)